LAPARKRATLDVLASPASTRGIAPGENLLRSLVSRARSGQQTGWESQERERAGWLGCLHAQNVAVAHGLTKEPAFPVLTAAHGEVEVCGGDGGGGGSSGGRRRGTAALAPDALKTGQTTEAEIDVFPITLSDALGRSCEFSDEEGRGRANSFAVGGRDERGSTSVADVGGGGIAVAVAIAVDGMLGR
jgi:hypothetical protein